MKKKVCTIIVAVLLFVGGVVLYCTYPKYIVYAVIATKDGPKWEEVYKSISHDKAKAEYDYLNKNKKDGVKGYILVDEESGNSIIPF